MDKNHKKSQKKANINKQDIAKTEKNKKLIALDEKELERVTGGASRAAWG